MKEIHQKIEAHRLTISGLPEKTLYGPLVEGLVKENALDDLVQKIGSKSHCLSEAEVKGQLLFLRFMSFKQGHRPDIYDLEDASLTRNPLDSSQTAVEWTHAVGMHKPNRYLLLLERNSAGIWPGTLERYIQWLLEDHLETVDERKDLTVNLELEPGREFLSRLDLMERITKATLRVVRPNPGWLDLEDELGDASEESDAKNVDVSMTSRRNRSLEKSKGIVGRIREAFGSRDLDYARIEGYRDDEKEVFNTKKLGRHLYLDLPLDDRGQVKKDAAWKALRETIVGMD